MNILFSLTLGYAAYLLARFYFNLNQTFYAMSLGTCQKFYIPLLCQLRAADKHYREHNFCLSIMFGLECRGVYYTKVVAKTTEDGWIITLELTGVVNKHMVFD